MLSIFLVIESNIGSHSTNQRYFPMRDMAPAKWHQESVVDRHWLDMQGIIVCSPTQKPTRFTIQVNQLKCITVVVNYFFRISAVSKWKMWYHFELRLGPS